MEFIGIIVGFLIELSAVKVFIRIIERCLIDLRAIRSLIREL